MAQAQEYGRAQVSAQQKKQRAMDDHQLRVRCVEHAIKSIDALPNINVTIPSGASITNNITLPNVTNIAQEIYNFVNAPLVEP